MAWTDSKVEETQQIALKLKEKQVKVETKDGKTASRFNWNEEEQQMFNDLLEMHLKTIENYSYKYHEAVGNREEAYYDLINEFYESLLAWNPDFGEGTTKFTFFFFRYAKGYFQKKVGHQYKTENGGYNEVVNGEVVRRKGKKALLSAGLKEADIRGLMDGTVITNRYDEFEKEEAWMKMKERFKMDDRRFDVIRMYCSNYNQEEIAKKYKISQSRVSTMIKSMAKQYPGLKQYIKENLLQ